MVSNSEGLPSIVLVHGAFIDGSGWEGVYRILRKKGFDVSIVQHPTLSLADDAAVTRRAVDAGQKPVILVGHSYGGAVITEAGNHPQVTGLVYIAAFAPDTGESVASANRNPAPGAPAPPIVTSPDGFLSLDKAKFPESFAADVEREKAEFMADSQVLWTTEALNGAVVGEPAWKTKPSWYLIAADDLMVPPTVQRSIAERIGATTAELPGSHSIFISRPEAVAKFIEEAAKGARAATS